MCMVLLLSISGSSRIDQQLGKNIATNLVTELFSKVPYTMFPYDAIQVKEFNPHMPLQEVEMLRPPSWRNSCIIRPNNKCVLDDSVPMQERILVPPCQLAPHLMMEVAPPLHLPPRMLFLDSALHLPYNRHPPAQDIGFASPLYDLCSVIGVQSVYRLPIELVPWPIPYPIGIPWPVQQYGAAGPSDDPERGYIVVAPGGRAKLWIYGRNEGDPYDLASVRDASMPPYRMGPRPLFATPCRGVFMSPTSIGVLSPMPPPGADGELDEDYEEDEPYHPGISLADYHTHPLRKLYNATTDSYLCWDPENNSCIPVKHEWVERNIIPMCTPLLVRAWAPCMSGLLRHISYRGRGSSATKEVMERDGVYVQCKVVPPREADSFTNHVWVSIEVRYTVGNLKNLPNADMITIKVPPEDLRPMIVAADYEHPESMGAASSRYTPKNGGESDARQPAAKRRKGAKGSSGGDDSRTQSGSIIVARFIYASRMSS